MIFLRKENDAQMSDFAFVKKAPSPCKKSFFKKKILSTVNITVEKFCQHRKKKKSCP